MTGGNAQRLWLCVTSYITHYYGKHNIYNRNNNDNNGNNDNHNKASYRMAAAARFRRATAPSRTDSIGRFCTRLLQHTRIINLILHINH